MNRYQANLEILKRLHDAVEKDKGLRFIQILWSLDIINSKTPNSDRFYEESIETLKKINEQLNSKEKTDCNQLSLDKIIIDEMIDTLIQNMKSKITFLQQLKQLHLKNEVVETILEELDK